MIWLTHRRHIDRTLIVCGFHVFQQFIEEGCYIHTTEQRISFMVEGFWRCVCVVLACLSLFFFFFQAEDGIRDYKVTGVQTCALPICHMVSGGFEAKQWSLYLICCILCKTQPRFRCNDVELPSWLH